MKDSSTHVSGMIWAGYVLLLIFLFHFIGVCCCGLALALWPLAITSADRPAREPCRQNALMPSGR